VTDLHYLRSVGRALRSAAALGLLALAGCYQVEDQAGGKTYSVALWVPGVVVLSGLALLAAGVLSFRRWNKPLGVLLMVVGPVLAVAVPPMMLLNKVVVDDRHFEVTDCFLWMIDRHDVAYDDVLGARLDLEKKQTRSAGKVKKYRPQTERIF
jgi:hypothetical protein